jgi:hypothetical protein
MMLLPAGSVSALLRSVVAPASRSASLALPLLALRWEL